MRRRGQDEPEPEGGGLRNVFASFSKSGFLRARHPERGNREVDERKPEQIRDEADHDNPMTVFHT